VRRTSPFAFPPKAASKEPTLFGWSLWSTLRWSTFVKSHVMSPSGLTACPRFLAILAITLALAADSCTSGPEPAPRASPARTMHGSPPATSGEPPASPTFIVRKTIELPHLPAVGVIAMWSRQNAIGVSFVSLRGWVIANVRPCCGNTPATSPSIGQDSALHCRPSGPACLPAEG
jgi:hypothetical protein